MYVLVSAIRASKTNLTFDFTTRHNEVAKYTLKTVRGILMTAWDFIPIAARYVKNGGYLSEETRVLMQEFYEQDDYDPQLYISVLKNILEDAVDEALELFI